MLKAMRRTRAAVLAAAAVVVHSVVVLIGWSASWPVFVRPSPDFKPMSPSTALAALVLSLALLALTSSRNIKGRTVTAIVCWMVAAGAFLNLLVPGPLDAFLGGAVGLFGPVQLGVMSPLTAAGLVLLGVALGLYDVRPQYATVCATLAAAVGGTVAIGYAYGTPLLYGTLTIPVALPTGLSLLVLGCAIVAAVGPAVWPLQPLAGPSPRARMLRAFLPTTAGLIVLLGLLDARFTEGVGVERVLVSVWIAVVGVAIVTLLVSRLAGRIGAELDAAYAEQHRAERRFNDVFDQTIIGFSTTRLSDGRMLRCNDVCAKLFGYDTAAEFIAAQPGNLWVDPRDRDQLVERFRETSVVRNLEARLRRRDGTHFWVLANLTRREGDDGEPILDNIFIDVSDRKSLEQQLWQAQKLDALGSLAGGVAHDFNNLLTAIIGYADILREELASNPSHVDDLNEIIKASDRATALTRQLLAFSRRQPFEPKSLRVDERVVDMEKMLRRLLGPPVRLVTATDADLSAIMADPNQLEQVVLNLAVNSRDAMPQGGTVTIETRNVRIDEPYAHGATAVPPGSYVMLAVSDTGSGMSQQTLARLFEPFFTTKEKGKGTGLGLSTVYGIVKQSQGHVIVYSEPGVGTTFKCYFPISDARPRISRPVQARIEVKGTETILLVEDEEPIRVLAETALGRLGYRILAAEDGAAAMRLAASHGGPIHLLLSDGVLSGIRVPELLRRFVAQRPETKILLMSGYSQEAVFQHDIVAPNTAFLPKPFTIRQLSERVREVLDS